MDQQATARARTDLAYGRRLGDATDKCDTKLKITRHWVRRLQPSLTVLKTSFLDFMNLYMGLKVALVDLPSSSLLHRSSFSLMSGGWPREGVFNSFVDVSLEFLKRLGQPLGPAPFAASKACKANYDNLRGGPCVALCKWGDFQV